MTLCWKIARRRRWPSASTGRSSSEPRRQRTLGVAWASASYQQAPQAAVRAKVMHRNRRVRCPAQQRVKARRWPVWTASIRRDWSRRLSRPKQAGRRPRLAGLASTLTAGAVSVPRQRCGSSARGQHPCRSTAGSSATPPGLHQSGRMRNPQQVSGIGPLRPWPVATKARLSEARPRGRGWSPIGTPPTKARSDQMRPSRRVGLACPLNKPDRAGYDPAVQDVSRSHVVRWQRPCADTWRRSLRSKCPYPAPRASRG